MSGGYNWSDADLALASQLRRDGLSYNAIAERFPGRSRRAVKDVLTRARVRAPEPEQRDLDGPPIGDCPVKQEMDRNAVAGSQALLQAILEMAR
jgi:hypothetical protein